jgi:hypothetical protein
MTQGEGGVGPTHLVSTLANFVESFVNKIIISNYDLCKEPRDEVIFNLNDSLLRKPYIPHPWIFMTKR